MEWGSAVPVLAEPVSLLDLDGDLLRAVTRHLARDDRFCARLTCKTLRDHCAADDDAADSDASSRIIGRVSFMRSRALVAYAWDQLPDFILGDHLNALQPGELLRSIDIPIESLTRRYSYQRFTLTKHGRSSEFLVGTTQPETGDLVLTITAATTRPIVVRFGAIPTTAELRAAIDAAVHDGDYFDDPNGRPAHRKHMTYYLAERIRRDLAGGQERSDSGHTAGEA
jgi:hypothetical protein